MVSRRSILAGLGGLVAGGGAVLGTGAFTAVEAQRTVDVETTGDANAFLGIEPFETGGTVSENAAAYVDASDDTVEIDITETDAGEGVNENAVTAIDRLLKVTNNGTQDVAVGFNDQYAIDNGDYETAESPGGWGYAINDAEDAAVVVWASPLPGDMLKSLEEVRPDLVSTGFTGSTLVDGRVDDEIEKKADRTISPGESLHIGAIVDTRTSTVENPDYTTPLSDLYPDEIDETVSLFADVVN
jgi:hypothetical protein